MSPGRRVVGPVCLPATFASVRDQDYDDIEHIVIDGGSTKGSAEILLDHAAHLAYWVSERDDWQADALCRGFEMATGSIQCWPDSDDLCEPWRLRGVVSYLTPHRRRFVFGDSTWARTGEQSTLDPRGRDPTSGSHDLD
jgi:glycosyltransferase involved in cell wall biosynthesis